MPSTISQTKGSPVNRTSSLPVVVSADSEGQPEHTIRRSRRLQGIPASPFDPKLPATIQAMPSDTMLATPAVFSAKAVPDEIIASSDNDSTLVGATDSDQTLGNSSLDDAQPSPTDLDTSTKNVLNQPDTDAPSEHGDTESESSDKSEIEQNDNKGNDRSNEPSLSKQDYRRSTLAKSSKKRKADTPSAKSAAQLDLTAPAKKKRKTSKPIATSQRQSGNARAKTVKERFVIASAGDNRPSPWGEPEVWAEV